jgi:hypothetical protein
MISRCPFAVLGLGSDHMAACPGFEGEVVRYDTADRGRSCLHLGTGKGGCHHPDADAVLPHAAALCRADVSRNRPVVVVEPAAGRRRGAKGTPAA